MDGTEARSLTRLGGSPPAIGSPTAASATNGSYPASNGVDGNEGTFWHSSTATGPHLWRCDLGGLIPLEAVTVVRRTGADYRNRINGMTVSVHQTADASDAAVFSAVIGIYGVRQTFPLPPGTLVRSIKVEGSTSSGWANMAEVYAYGELPMV